MANLDVNSIFTSILLKKKIKFVAVLCIATLVLSSLYAEEEFLVALFRILKVVKIETEENNSKIYPESVINNTDIIKYVEEGRIAWNNI